MRRLWNAFAIAAVLTVAPAVYAVQDNYCINQTATIGQNTYNNGILINPDSGNAYSTSCIPPNLQAVEATSFSVVFKLDDSDANTPYVVALYGASAQPTASPTQFKNVAASTVCTHYYGGYTSTPACYQKATFTGLTPNTQYYYNVNVGTQGTCVNGASCNTCSTTGNPSPCNISGGNWFASRRPVKTAPAPVANASQPVHLVIMGDSRDGEQGSCGSSSPPPGQTNQGEEGYWYPGNSVICGGSATERNNYGAAVASYHASNHIDQIVHGGDIASSDAVRETMTFWANMGSWWRDISINFAYGNHEFGSVGGATLSNPPAGTPALGEQEIFGTHLDTNSDDMITPPQTPVSIGTVPYPTANPTYYSQNYGNVHIVYLNTQLCVIDGLDYDPKHSQGTSTCADAQTPTVAGAYETQSNQPCSCWAYTNTQRAWLINDLRAANADPAVDWIFVSHHKAYWSNGPVGTGTTGEWTNSLARKEYVTTSDSANLTATGPAYQLNQFLPLDAIYQMYNVDLVFSSHAHYYELVNDTRYRTPGDGLLHMLVGGSAAAEQLYQCPVATANCNVGPLNTSKSALVTHLPANVGFVYASDSRFVLGDVKVTGTTLQRGVYAVMGNAVAGAPLESSVMHSRKGAIRANATVGNSRFNGCNVPYPPSNMTANIANVNCTVQ